MRNPFALFFAFAFFAATLHSQPFTLTPDRAFQASFPTKEGYEYQLFSSPDLTNWFPAGERIIGCGGIETLSYKITNSNTFYRGEEFPPNLTQRFIGLTNVFFGTASVASSNTPDAPLKISGIRIQSRDYTFNDYVVANYSLDFCKQTLSPVQVQVYTNVGVTTKPGTTTFFFKDVTNSICVTNGASVYCTQDTGSSLTTTGQVIYVGLHAGQLLSIKTSTSSSGSQYRYIVKDPEGHELDNYGPVPAATSFSLGAFQALLTGTYSFQFIPLNASSFTMTLRFFNINGRTTRTLVNGATYPSTLKSYPYDYDKFQVALTAGQTVSMSGLESGTAFSLYDSMGVYQTSIGGGTLVFQATNSGTYYVIFDNTDSAGHSVTIASSIF